MVAFLATLASAQVMNRDQVSSAEMIEMKKKAKAQGLNAIPTEWMEDARQVKMEGIKNKLTAAANSEQKTAKKAIQKPNVERKLIQSDALSLREKAKQITPPPGFKVVIRELGGKEYIQFVELPQQNGVVPARAKN